MAALPEDIAERLLHEFNDLRKRSKATHELASFVEAAIPLLRSILDGSRLNRWGVPWRKVGIPLDCAIITCGLMKEFPRSLLELVQLEAERGHPYAIDVLERKFR